MFFNRPLSYSSFFSRWFLWRAQQPKWLCAWCVVLSMVVLIGCSHPKKSIKPVKEEAPPSLQCESLGQETVGERVAYNIEALLDQLEEERALAEEEKEVPFEDTQAAALLVNMERGKLVVASGSEELVSGHFLYDICQPAPSLSYQSFEKKRVVEMLGLGRDNSWRLFLSKHVPYTIKIESSGGFREFDFDEVAVEHFSLRAMSGSTLVTFPGDRRHLTLLDISQCSGSISLDASGHFEELQSATIETGKGNIAAAFTGSFDRLEDLTIKAYGGSIDLSLTGCWARTPRICIIGTCGDLRLTVPGGVGTSVRMRHTCSNVSAPGMLRTWSNKAYINAAYGKTDVLLDIEVSATCGAIEIINDPECCP